MSGKENIIKEKSMQFALEIIAFGEKLNRMQKFVVAKQLLRSGTAIGALIHESQFAESKVDFIHKLKIALKEANETLYWIEVCEHSSEYPSGEELKSKVVELIKIITAIINSLSKNIS